MKKTEAYDTGIYRDEPKLVFPLKNKRDLEASLEAFQSGKQANNKGLCTLDRLLTDAEQFATNILSDPEVKDCSVHNWQRRKDYALHLRSYVRTVRASREQGDWEQAIVDALWLGRYWEASRVLRTEWVALRGRKNVTATRKGHAAKHGTQEEKQARWTAYQTTLDTQAAKNPSWSLTALRAEVAKQFGVSSKTIERHTKLPQKLG